MMLDDCFMITEFDNNQYHKKCIELCYKKDKELDVLIIGGGDFGLVKKLFNKIYFNNKTILKNNFHFLVEIPPDTLNTHN